jgi:hypothetical protein
MRRTVLKHVCGPGRERPGVKCACTQKVSRARALDLIARGHAVWWKRLDVSGGLVTVHYAIALIATDWNPARTITAPDILRAYTEDDTEDSGRGRRERERIEEFQT